MRVDEMVWQGKELAGCYLVCGTVMIGYIYTTPEVMQASGHLTDFFQTSTSSIPSCPSYILLLRHVVSLFLYSAVYNSDVSLQLNRHK